MKITIYKFLTDRDFGMSCELFFSLEKLTDAVWKFMAKHPGVDLPSDSTLDEIFEYYSEHKLEDNYMSWDSETIEVPTPHEIAESIIAEIRKDPKLRTCRSFEELHDHCDADMLGDSQKLLDILSLENAVEILDAAQNIVSDHLERGDRLI